MKGDNNNEVKPDFYDFEYYLSMELRYLSGAHKAKIDLLFKMLGNVKNKRVLDLGCGGGFFTNELSKRGAIVTGIDYSSSAIDFSNDRYPGFDFRLGDAKSLPSLKKGSFDIVLLIDVIEHIVDQNKTLIEIGALLKKDGLLLISTDIDDSPWNVGIMPSIIRFTNKFSSSGRAYNLIKKVEVERKKKKNYHDSHVSVLPVRNLISLISSNGFKVCKVKVYALIRVPLRDLILKFLPEKFRGDHVMIIATKN